MKIEIFIPMYNEEELLPYTIAFYRERLPNCDITLLDNVSTDNSVEIAKKLKCKVVHWGSNNEINDLKLIELKNNCWKKSKADYIFVIDMDEWVNILPNQITGTLLRHNAYEMVGEGETPDKVNRGVRTPTSDKVFGFKRTVIKDINFHIGAHSCSPFGKVIENDFMPNMYHMRYFNVDRLINRYKVLANRLSELNKTNSWGWHYNNKEETIRKEYNELLQKAEIIR